MQFDSAKLCDTMHRDLSDFLGGLTQIDDVELGERWRISVDGRVE